jgi:hypothetical protein
MGNTHQTTELDIPEDLHLQQHCGEELKSHGTFLLMESAGIWPKFLMVIFLLQLSLSEKGNHVSLLNFYKLSLRCTIKEKITQCVNILCIPLF